MGERKRGRRMISWKIERRRRKGRNKIRRMKGGKGKEGEEENVDKEK